MWPWIRVLSLIIAARLNGCTITFDVVISDHAVLQASPLPFSLFGQSNGDPGKLSVTLSGHDIQIQSYEITRSADENIFFWNLVGNISTH